MSNKHCFRSLGKLKVNITNLRNPSSQKSSKPPTPISVTETVHQIFVNKDNNWLVRLRLFEAQHSVFLQLREISWRFLDITPHANDLVRLEDSWCARASNDFQTDMSKGARMLSKSAPLQENASSSRLGSVAILLE